VTVALQDFLTSFKSAPDEIATALGKVTINDADLDDNDDDNDGDDNDAMDQDGPGPRHGRTAPRKKYVEMMQQLADRKIDEVMIDIDDVAQFEKEYPYSDNLKLAESIETNTKHYVELMSRAVDKLMPQPSEDVTYVVSVYIYTVCTGITDGIIKIQLQR